MNGKRSRWFRWQRGQALAEYHVLIPGSIIILLSAAGLVQFITGSLMRAVEGLEHTGAMECEMVGGVETKEGPLFAETSGKELLVVADVESEGEPSTTITIEVTDKSDPAISNIGFSIPKEVYEAITHIEVIGAAGWKYEWVDMDPNAGMPGLKFEGLFDDGGGGGKPPEGGEKPPKKKSSGEIVLVGYPMQATGDSVTILITLAGYFEWDITEVWIKAGTTVLPTQISLPSRFVEASNPNDC
jgi:hypothetical protein